MYTGLLHTHRLVVIIFLLLYVVKWVLLIANRKNALTSLSGRTRIAEMVLSVLFLGTGIGLMAMTAQVSAMLMGKIAMVLASIPLAIIGFRKSNKLLATLSVLLLVGAYGLAEMDKAGVSKEALAANVITDPAAPGYDMMSHGKAIYMRNCVVCHGEDGAAAKSGAKNLQTSQLNDDQLMPLLSKGKNAMPAYEKVLNEGEMNAVINYILTMRIPQAN